MNKETPVLAHADLEQAGVQQLQDRMSQDLGLVILVTYPDGRPLTGPSNLNPFCALLHTASEGRSRCKASCAAAARAAAAAGGKVLHTCHAGLVRLAIPLRVVDETVAVLLAGGVVLCPLEEEAVARLALEAGLDPGELATAAGALPVWSEGQLRTAGALVGLVTEIVAQLVHAVRETREEADRLAFLYDFSRTVSGSLEVREVAQRALEAVLEVTGATSGSVVMLHEELPGALARETAATLESESEFRIVPTGEVVAAVEREGCAVHFDSHPGAGGAIERRPAVAVPLMVGGRVTGVLTVAGRPEGALFSAEDAAFLTTLGTGLGLALENARLYASLRQYYLNALQALAAALEAKDAYTRGHSVRVARLAQACARALALSAEQQEHLYLAALLHDMGKIGVPESILLKPGRPDLAEWEVIKRHPGAGAEILKPARFPAEVVTAVRYHHEDYDGGGYPEGLAGEEIPLLARVIRVADAYDAMTSDRPYRRGLTAEEAIEELRQGTGRQFDPRVVEAFLRIPASEQIKYGE